MLYAPKPQHNELMHYYVFQHQQISGYRWPVKMYWNGQSFVQDMFQARLYTRLSNARQASKALTKSTGIFTYAGETSQIFNMMRVYDRLDEEQLDRLNM